jgi:hypothetical protein
LVTPVKLIQRHTSLNSHVLKLSLVRIRI